MFLTKDYILTYEFAKKLNITINNFSPWLKWRPDLVGTDLIKLGECVFFKKSIPLLGRSFRLKLPELELTDFTNKIPITYLKSEYKFNPKFCESHGLGKVIDVCGKKFFEFDWDFAYKNRRKIWYLMSLKEYEDYEKTEGPLQHFQVSRDYLVTLY